jgi:hypothetical protein
MQNLARSIDAAQMAALMATDFQSRWRTGNSEIQSRRKEINTKFLELAAVLPVRSSLR